MCLCKKFDKYDVWHFQYESSLHFMEQKEEVTHLQDITDANCVCPNCWMYLSQLLNVFVKFFKCICTIWTMFLHLNTLIHFQYESSLRFMEQKEEAVFHRQTPPEYHKIAKNKNQNLKITKEKTEHNKFKDKIKIKI